MHLSETREPLASLLDRSMAASDKTLHQIGEECGFQKSNILSMIRKGLTKMPLSRIPALARALGLDERELFEIAIMEYQPDLWSVLEDIYGISGSPRTRHHLPIDDLTD